MKWIIAMVLALPAFADGGRSAARGEDVLLAASGRHVFVVREAEQAGDWDIAHLDVEIGPGSVRTIHTVGIRPEAIAAEGARCWVVLPPRDADRVARLVISLEVARHPINGVWFANPPGPPRVLPPVPREGRVAGIIATPSELLLAFAPSQRVARGIERPERPSGPPSPPASEGDAGDEAAPDILERGGMLRLPRRGSTAWEPVASPTGWDRADRIVAGLVDRASALVPAIAWTAVGEDAWRLSILEGAGDPSWSDHPLEDQAGEMLSLAASIGRTSVAARTDDGATAIGDVLVGEAAAPAVVRPFASLPAGDPASDVGMVLVPTGPWVVGVDGREVVTTTLDRATGAAAGAIVASEATAEGSLVPYELALLVAASAFLAAFLMRPFFLSAPSQPPAGLRGLGLTRRAAGLCIDLVPGVVVSIVVYRLDPLAYLESLRAGAPSSVPPFLLAMGVAGASAGLLEVVVGRSLGKLLVGGAVLQLDGSPASRLQRGVRAGLKMAVLILPPAWPIVILGLLDPLGRGVPELVTRTVVAPRG